MMATDRREELKAKSFRQIQEETARIWCDRAAAAYRLYLEDSSAKWLFEGEEFYHEAIEHAASVGPELVAYVQSALRPLRYQVLPFL